MNPNLIQAAKQRVNANAAAFVNEFKRFSVPAMAEAEENGITRITIGGDANQNSHDDDALSHERLSDMVKAMKPGSVIVDLAAPQGGNDRPAPNAGRHRPSRSSVQQ